MLHLEWLLIVAGLFLGTYTVRALPFWFSGIDRLPPRVQRFLELVPAAALGALIVPDTLAQAPPAIAVATPLVAFVLTLRGLNLTAVVAISILLAWGGLALVG